MTGSIPRAAARNVPEAARFPPPRGLRSLHMANVDWDYHQRQVQEIRGRIDRGYKDAERGLQQARAATDELAMAAIIRDHLPGQPAQSQALYLYRLHRKEIHKLMHRADNDPWPALDRWLFENAAQAKEELTRAGLH